MSLKPRLKTLFCGTPDFALPCLELLHYHPQIDLRQVVTASSKPVGRGNVITPPPVAIYAQTHKLPYLQTDDINKDLDLAQFHDLDLMVVLAFGQFLKEPLLKLPKRGAFNIHTSLLPRFRGAAPIQAALSHGDLVTGVTIQKMVKKMDAGDVAFQKELPIRECENLPLLSTRLKYLAALSLEEFLFQLIEETVVYTPQDESKVTFAPTLKKEDGFLDFKNMTSVQIKNILRAFDPWPSAYCFFNKKRVKIFEVLPYPHKKVAAGQVESDMGAILVGCQDGVTLRLVSLQLEGKKRCSDSELLNGWREKIYL